MLSLLLAATATAIGTDPDEPSKFLLLAHPHEPGLLLARAYQDAYDRDAGRGGLYLQIGGGLTTTIESDGPDEDLDFDEGFAIPVALGTRFGADDGNAAAFDVELEAIYTDQDADNQGVLEAVTDVTAIAGLVNGVGDFSVSEAISLYAGAGIGLAGLDIGTTSDSVNDFDEEDGPFLAWQLKGGLRFWATDNVSWSVGYRFLNIDDAEIDDDLGGADFDLETRQHVVELGLRFQL